MSAYMPCKKCGGITQKIYGIGGMSYDKCTECGIATPHIPLGESRTKSCLIGQSKWDNAEHVNE